MDLNNAKIAVIGLGYVGLPLAVEFGKHYPTIGFDINKKRVNELQGGHDHTLEVEPEELAQADKLSYSADIQDLHHIDPVMCVHCPCTHHSHLSAYPNRYSKCP